MSESQNKVRLFDAGKDFEVPVFSGEEKRCTVRYPTDAEWIARAAGHRTIYDSLGRGKTRARVLNTERVDGELFAKIRKDDGPEFTGAEASSVLERLQRAQVTGVKREGNTFRISMQVAGAVTEHVLAMPLRADVDAMVDGSATITNARRYQEVRLNIEPAVELYAKIHISHAGYAGEVPAPHKDAAVAEVIAQVRALEEEADDPET